MRLLCLSLGQVVIGCLLVAIGLWIDNWYLPPLGIFLGSWFWIPLSMAARDKPRARARLACGLIAAAVLVAGLMGAAFFLIPDKGYEVMLGVGIGGLLFLVAPLALAWAGAGESSRRQQPWGRMKGGPRTVAGLALSVDVSSDSDFIRVGIEITDPKYLGQSATLEIYRLADVHDSRPVNDLKMLSSQELVLDRERIDLMLRAREIRGLAYRGKQVSVRTFAEIRLDDGVLWDTAVRTELGLPEHRVPEPQGDAKVLAEPKDAFSLVRNLRVIPLHRRAAALVLLAIGAAVVGVNSAVGLHDQLSPAGAHFVYSRRDSDGDSTSPLGNSLFISGAAGTGIWLALRRQLRSYTTFKLARTPRSIGRDTVIAIDQLVHGRPTNNLEQATVRVVAYNLEKGSYTRGSGSNQRTVNFAEPVRAVVLFEQELPRVARGQPLERALSGPVRFEPVFDLLHPPVEVSQTHGLALQWEVQLLHDEFIDHELIAGGCTYQAGDFTVAAAAAPEAASG